MIKKNHFKQVYKMFKNESLYFCQQQQIQQNPKGILICTKKTFKCYFCQPTNARDYSHKLRDDNEALLNYNPLFLFSLK